MDCTGLICLPVELFLGFMAMCIGVAIFGFVRNPQVPAMLAFAGIFILFIAVMTSGIIMGSVPESSSTSGSTTTYDMIDNTFDFRGFPQMIFGLLGGIMMLTSALMVGFNK
jgi:hypothetical protein